MVGVDLAQSCWRAVEKKQKNPAIFANSFMLRGQPAFDWRMSFLPPIWLIVVVPHRLLEVLKVFWRRIFLIMVLRRHSDGATVSFWSFLADFQFDFSSSSHSCFRLSTASFDEAWNEERRGADGRA
jgi:hypothetical protein